MSYYIIVHGQNTSTLTFCCIWIKEEARLPKELCYNLNPFEIPHIENLKIIALKDCQKWGRIEVWVNCTGAKMSIFHRK